MFLEREQDALLQEYKSKLVHEASVGALHRLNAAQDSLRSLRDEREVNFPSETPMRDGGGYSLTARNRQESERYGYGSGTALAKRKSGGAGARGWIERSFEK